MTKGGGELRGNGRVALLRDGEAIKGDGETLKGNKNALRGDKGQ